MGFTYLGGKNWLDATREERLFCSYLHWDIKGKERDFVRWLNKNTDLVLRVDENWEIGFEVCFYRDLQKLRKEPLDLTRYSSKRTFDLCLFSENAIVIIEAKVQQMFKENDVQQLQKDRKNIPAITGKDLDVVVVALASSKYFDNYCRYGRRDILSKHNFDALITWKQMSELYRRKTYLEADQKYKS